MKNTGTNKLHYLLCAMLLFALTGCGANNLANLTGTGEPGAVSAKMVYAQSKTAAKELVTLAAAPAGVGTIQVTFTGTGTNGSAIPVVRSSISITTSTGTTSGIYPGTVTMAVKAFAADGITVLYEGFAIGVVVNAGATTTIANPIIMSPPVEKAQDVACIQCHETTLDATGQNLVAEFKQSGHYTNSSWNSDVDFPGVVGTGCAGCHGPSHNVPNPATAGRCNECHNATGAVAHNGNVTTAINAAGFVNNCDACHNSHNPVQFVGGDCLACHAVAQNANSSTYVQDNAGVRPIVGEFGKWSHHVTGVNLNAAHCTACHLEGKIFNGAVVVDSSKHMSDNQTHLRNGADDSDMAWNPAQPSFTTLDTFCLGCHNASGAISPMSAQIQAYINAKGIAAAGKTASATNPFGDTISNRYDKMQRPAVVDAAGQFNTGNNSHHAVLGQKYSGRTRVGSSRQVNVAAFTGNSTAAMPGIRSTIFDAGRFNGTYTTLGDTAGEVAPRNGGSSLGDDSTLHCADCHTVGQYRAADVGAKPYNNAVIGAHGSNNEYLLRNNAGTDARHTGALVNTQNGSMPYLVCYNCHNLATYAIASHAGEEDASNDCNGPYNTFGNYTASGTARLITRTSTGALISNMQGGGFGNIFGIQCANCHNSGLDNGFGGIHGSKVQTYTDGMGNTSKHRRFMPGLANAMFVPGTKGGFTGGTQATFTVWSSNRLTGAAQTFGALPIRNPSATGASLPYPNVPAMEGGSYTYTTGGISNDLNWEQTTAQSIAGQTDPSASAMGCYTLDPIGIQYVAINATAHTPVVGPTTDTRLLATNNIQAPNPNGPGTVTAYGSWGSCNHHQNAQGTGETPIRGDGWGPDKTYVRPVTY